MPEQNSETIAQTRGTAFSDAGDGYSRTPADLPPGMSAPTGMPPLNGVGGPQVPEQAAGSTNTKVPDADTWLLQKARDIYINSKDYMEANITLGWERNLYHFHGEHGPASPYTRSNYRRARTFRPKTRANVKASEAAHAAAAFATQDYLMVDPFDPTNEQQVISATITKILVQYRLRTAPWSWFLTAQGAWQDTKVYGCCISHQYWSYETVEEVVPAFDDDGKPILDEESQQPMGLSTKRTIKDLPVCDLLPPECVLFDPMCDWRNPMQSSPYICVMFGMYASDVLDRMQKNDPKTGQPVWRPLTLAQIVSAAKENEDSRTRRAREGYHRVDPTMSTASREFTMVWAHLNIMRVDGVDIAWWTLGTQFVLTDPMPLTQMYPHLAAGERPFVMGYSVVESHRNYPDGDVAQIAPLQAEINDIANQRLDNVKLVLNKRYFVRRGSQIDLDALMRNVPGGGVMTNDPEKDVVTINTPDVTGSSYQEQDRLSMDLDELVGGFGQQAAAAQGKMVDRAGSLDQIQGAAGAVQDYGIRIFFETWMEPVLRQMVKLEQMYETDATILAVAAKQSPLWIRYGTDQVTDENLQQDLIVSINVGIGNTDPVKRVQKLTFGVGQVMQLPDMQRRVKSDEVANEIFGALGYKNASRFFMNDQELEEHMKTTPPAIPPEIQLQQQELSIRQKDMELRDQRERQAEQNQHQWRMQQLQQNGALADEKLQHSTGIQAARNKTVRDIAAAKEANRMSEINLRRADGAKRPG